MDSNHRAKDRLVKWGLLLVCGVLVATFSSPGLAQKKQQKEMKFEGAEIEGEREKPRNLYILPWKHTTPLEETQLETKFLNDSYKDRDRFQMEAEYDYFQKVGVYPTNP